MPGKTIYFDESGFTGYNLLDDTQPIFVVASSDIEPGLAEDILRKSFPKYQGAEFKFGKVWRKGNRGRLTHFAERLGSLDRRTFSWVTHKKFAVLTKIVDYLIEPLFTDSGFDFYSDGFCWKYANYIHYGLSHFAEPALYDRLLLAYQSFSREPSREALTSLQAQLDRMARSAPERVRIFIEQMALGTRLFGSSRDDFEAYRGSNELQVSTVIAIMMHWRRLCPDDFHVVHDASANFFRHRETWERISNNDVPDQLHPLGDGTFVQLPLRVTSTTPSDSAHDFGVQLCDVLAGLVARHFDPRTSGDDRKLLDEVIAAGLHKLDYNGVRPEPVFPDQIPPRPLQGPDAVDRMVEIITGPHHRHRDG